MPRIGIPKTLMHIWIGDLPPPTQWMETWRRWHPDWNYRLIDNGYLSHTTFRNQPLIDEYLRRMDFAGAADLIRYEVLFNDGGFIAEADSICQRNTDALWKRACAYTIHENEIVRKGLYSPILAAEPGNQFVGLLIETLGQLKPHELRSAWKTVGNRFLGEMIANHQPDNLVIFPSHYFLPSHFTGQTYEGDGPVYAWQMWGSTQGLYETSLSSWGKFKRKFRKKVSSKFHPNELKRRFFA